MNITIKGGKKRKISFVTDAKGGEGTMKGTKVSVAPGMSKDSKPNLPEPEKVQTSTILPQRSLIQKNPSPAAPSPSPFGGGAPAPNPFGGGAPSRPTPGARPTPGGAPPSPMTRGGAPRPASRGGPPRGGRGMPMPGMPRGGGRGRGGGRPY